MSKLRTFLLILVLLLCTYSLWQIYKTAPNITELKKQAILNNEQILKQSNQLINEFMIKKSLKEIPIEQSIKLIIDVIWDNNYLPKTLKELQDPMFISNIMEQQLKVVYFHALNTEPSTSSKLIKIQLIFFCLNGCAKASATGTYPDAYITQTFAEFTQYLETLNHTLN